MQRLCLLFLAVAGLLLAGCQDRITSPNGTTGPSAGVQDGPGSAGPPGQATPSTPDADCDITVGSASTYTEIQPAVIAAGPGSIVCVESGTYREQILIEKDLVLKGLGDPVIESPHPDHSASFTIAESEPTWEPIIFAYGGGVSNGTVSGSETIDVSISGFTIDGRGQQPHARRSVAIFLRNVQSTKGVRDNVIEKMGLEGKETFGILAYGNSEVTIAGNEISGYERGGIGANGDGGAHPAPNVTIKNNHITGSTGIGVAWGPNGIQVGYGASGRIIVNTVIDNRYGGPNDFASGIIVYQSNGVDIRGNTVKNADIGIAPALGENGKILQNEVVDADYGAFLFQADNTKLVNNTLSAPSSDLGIIGILNLGTNNKLINNHISNFTTKISDVGNETKIAANNAGYSP